MSNRTKIVGFQAVRLGPDGGTIFYCITADGTIFHQSGGQWYELDGLGTLADRQAEEFRSLPLQTEVSK